MTEIETGDWPVRGAVSELSSDGPWMAQRWSSRERFEIIEAVTADYPVVRFWPSFAVSRQVSAAKHGRVLQV